MMELQNLVVLTLLLLLTQADLATSQASNGTKTEALTVQEVSQTGSSSSSSTAATSASPPSTATSVPPQSTATAAPPSSATTAAPPSAATPSPATVGVSSAAPSTSSTAATPPPESVSGNVAASEEVVTVLTFLGVVNGHRITSPASGKTHFRFQGVPYAQPPVGSLRFLEPLPAAAWGNIDAFDLKSPCAQILIFGPTPGRLAGSEDCLYLNIYTPALPAITAGGGGIGRTIDRSALKPVMVWIHGGGFIEGSGGEYYPSALVEKEVVVVTLNYRLASLGFLSFGNSVVGGNMGLRDQLEALRWVQRYIHHFGGDPDKVTLFGESAGAVSVHALYLSPLSNGLFSAAIAQSGTMFMTRNANDKKRQERNARAVSRFYGCESPELDFKTLACLQAVPVENLILNTTHRGFDTSKDGQMAERGSWWPVVDSHAVAPVVPLEPLHAMRIGAFRQVPLMTGTVKNEGALQLFLSQALSRTAQETEIFWNLTGPLVLQVTASNNWTEITGEERAVANIARKYYTDTAFDIGQSTAGWVDLFTDAVFLSPDQKTAQLVAPRVPNVYNYVLTFADQFSLARVFGAKDNTLAPVHGDDLGYLFDLTLFNVTFTEPERQLSEKMTNYWTNFAKYGNPSPFITDGLPLWLPYSEKKNYMELKPEPEMRANVAPERMMFWQRLYWNHKESELERWSLYQRLSNFFLGSQFPSLV